MAGEPTIIIEIDSKGNRYLKTEGMEGDECVTMPAALEQALGGVQQGTVEYLPEFYRKPRQRAVILRQGDEG